MLMPPLIEVRISLFHSGRALDLCFGRAFQRAGHTALNG